jgi:hypothetical protein
LKGGARPSVYVWVSRSRTKGCAGTTQLARFPFAQGAFSGRTSPPRHRSLEKLQRQPEAGSGSNTGLVVTCELRCPRNVVCKAVGIAHSKSEHKRHFVVHEIHNARYRHLIGPYPNSILGTRRFLAVSDKQNIHHSTLANRHDMCSVNRMVWVSTLPLLPYAFAFPLRLQ